MNVHSVRYWYPNGTELTGSELEIEQGGSMTTVQVPDGDGTLRSPARPGARRSSSRPTSGFLRGAGPRGSSDIEFLPVRRRFAERVRAHGRRRSGATLLRRSTRTVRSRFDTTSRVTSRCSSVSSGLSSSSAASGSATTTDRSSDSGGTRGVRCRRRRRFRRRTAGASVVSSTSLFRPFSVRFIRSAAAQPCIVRSSSQMTSEPSISSRPLTWVVRVWRPSAAVRRFWSHRRGRRASYSSGPSRR